jgi:hypothetical protein
MRSGVEFAARSLSRFPCPKFIDGSVFKEVTMPGIFDRLQDQLGDDSSDGISPLDIVDLPDTQRQVMKLLLRDRTASTEGITLDEMREKLPELDDLPKVIAELSAASWLIMLGEPPAARYKINLRKKRSTLSNDMWSTLTGKIDEDDQ